MKEMILEGESSESRGLKAKAVPKLKDKLKSQMEQINAVSLNSKECQTITTVREMDNVNAYFMKAITAMNQMRQHVRSGFEQNIK